MRRGLRNMAGVMVVSALLVGYTSCKREERGYRVQPPDADVVNTVSVTQLHPGTTQMAPATQPSFDIVPAAVQGGIEEALKQSSAPVPPVLVRNAYEGNAFAISQGQGLFEAYNCVGCHSHGGGGMGPPLMDNKWIYGSEPAQVAATILQGRPNGMPSFRGKIPDYQVWQIVAYVRSLSGLTSHQAASGREEHMHAAHAPNSTASTQPVNSFEPPSAEQSQ